MADDYHTLCVCVHVQWRCYDFGQGEGMDSMEGGDWLSIQNYLFK